jgi:hypothetical protein
VKPRDFVRHVLQGFRSRRTHISDEPFHIDAGLVGLPLAGLPRRAVALVVDTLFCTLLMVPLALGLLGWVIRIEDPALGRVIFADSVAVADSALVKSLNLKLYELAHRNTPESLPPAVNAALDAGDTRALDSLLLLHEPNVVIDFAEAEAWRWKPGNPVQLNATSLLGNRTRFFSLLTVVMVYFTVLVRLGKGRSPGKWLFGLRGDQAQRAPAEVLGLFRPGRRVYREPVDFHAGFFRGVLGPQPDGDARQDRRHGGDPRGPEGQVAQEKDHPGPGVIQDLPLGGTLLDRRDFWLTRRRGAAERIPDQGGVGCCVKVVVSGGGSVVAVQPAEPRPAAIGGKVAGSAPSASLHLRVRHLLRPGERWKTVGEPGILTYQDPA